MGEGEEMGELGREGWCRGDGGEKEIRGWGGDWGGRGGGRVITPKIYASFFSSWPSEWSSTSPFPPPTPSSPPPHPVLLSQQRTRPFLKQLRWFPTQQLHQFRVPPEQCARVLTISGPSRTGRKDIFII